MIRTPFVAILIAVATLSFAPSTQDGVTVRSLKFAETPLDDLSHVLRVTRISADYDLRGVTNRAGLRFDVFRKGKQVGDPIRSVFLTGRQEKERAGKFSIQIADADYLKLGDAPKGHHRVFIALQEGVMQCRGTCDIPKTVFDFATVKASGTFLAERAEKGRIPLFFRIGGAVDSIRPGESPDAVVEGNPDADILVGYLEVE